MPVILVSAFNDAGMVSQLCLGTMPAEAEHIMGYLVKPIKQADLAPTIALAVHRFEQCKMMRQDRKVIEQAKGILMKKGKLGAPEEFCRLEKLASDNNQKLAEIAAMLVAADEAFQSSKIGQPK